MDPFFASLGFGFVTAVADLLGGLILAVKTQWDQLLLKYFIAFGAGFMLSAAILKMVPESFQLTASAPIFVLVGYLLIHFAEHILASHFHFGEETHRDVMLDSFIGVAALAGLLIHGFFDGVSIASGFLVAPSLGLLIFGAILLHKAPEGFTVASIMLASGRTKKQALVAAGAVGVATVIGVLAMSVGSAFASYGLAISAGVTIYVAASDLIPEVNAEKGAKMALMVFGGVALFYVSEKLLGVLGL
ncbi:MAG: ZIP family metal transporter [Chloroflexi bacterium]|nr:ZIP family metal transporter [Chloroflexota bacterium]